MCSWDGKRCRFLLLVFFSFPWQTGFRTRSVLTRSDKNCLSLFSILALRDSSQRILRSGNASNTREEEAKERERELHLEESYDPELLGARRSSLLLLLWAPVGTWAMIKCLPPVVEKAPRPFSCDAFFLFTWSKQKRLGMNRVRRRERGPVPRFTSNIEAPYSFLSCAPSIEEVWSLNERSFRSRDVKSNSAGNSISKPGRPQWQAKVKIASQNWSRVWQVEKRSLRSKSAPWGSLNWSLERRCLNGAIRGEKRSFWK